MEELKENEKNLSEEEKDSIQEKLEQELKEWKERALRYAAEVENLKKSFKREREEYFKFALESVFKELLPSVDNLEMALKAFETTQNIESLKEGVNLTLKVMVQTLEKFGLKQFEPIIGDTFHPHFHEALQVEVHPEIPNGRITKVFQKGYMLHDRVIRPALVCVCQGKPETKETKESEEENIVENE